MFTHLKQLATHPAVETTRIQHAALIPAHHVQLLLILVALRLVVRILVRLGQDSNDQVHHDQGHQHQLQDDHYKPEGFVGHDFKVAHPEIAHQSHSEAAGERLLQILLVPKLIVLALFGVHFLHVVGRDVLVVDVESIWTLFKHFEEDYCKSTHEVGNHQREPPDILETVHDCAHHLR